MPSRLAIATIFGTAFVVALGGFFAVGRLVVTHGEPPMLWQWERSLVNHSTLVAWWLTCSCYPGVLIPICIALLVVAWRFPAWRARVVLSIALLLLCWRGADLFQHLFARPRRLDWVVKHETSFSYPSSHAAIATGFYGLWAVLLSLSQLPKGIRIASSALLALFAAAICWARLALGAHYVTDLAGGALFGIALVCAAVAIVPGAFFGRVAGRVSAAAE